MNIANNVKKITDLDIAHTIGVNDAFIVQTYNGSTKRMFYSDLANSVKTALNLQEGKIEFEEDVLFSGSYTLQPTDMEGGGTFSKTLDSGITFSKWEFLVVTVGGVSIVVRSLEGGRSMFPLMTIGNAQLNGQILKILPLIVQCDVEAVPGSIRVVLEKGFQFTVGASSYQDIVKNVLQDAILTKIVGLRIVYS